MWDADFCTVHIARCLGVRITENTFWPVILKILVHSSVWTGIPATKVCMASNTILDAGVLLLPDSSILSFSMESSNKIRSIWVQWPWLSPIGTDSLVETHTKVVWKVCRLLATWHTVALRICIAQNISHYFTSMFLKGGTFKNTRITFSPKAFLIFQNFILHSWFPKDISFAIMQMWELMLCTHHLWRSVLQLFWLHDHTDM